MGRSSIQSSLVAMIPYLIAEFIVFLRIIKAYVALSHPIKLSPFFLGFNASYALQKTNCKASQPHFQCVCKRPLHNPQQILNLSISQHNISVPDQVGTLAQDGTSPNMGWPNKELTTLSLLRPKIP